MSTTEAPGGFKADLLKRLHHPIQLRVIITGIILVVAYAGVYMPLDSRIVESERKLATEERRLGLARDIEHLRKEHKRIQDRLPRECDQNEWAAYLLGGIRALPLKLDAFEKRPPESLGPYKVLVFSCELEGSFQDIEQLLRWIEFNERLFRVDSMRLAPHRSNNGLLVLNMIVVGVMG